MSPSLSKNLPILISLSKDRIYCTYFITQVWPREKLYDPRAALKHPKAFRTVRQGFVIFVLQSVPAKQRRKDKELRAVRGGGRVHLFLHQRAGGFRVNEMVNDWFTFVVGEMHILFLPIYEFGNEGFDLVIKDEDGFEQQIELFICTIILSHRSPASPKSGGVST